MEYQIDKKVDGGCRLSCSLSAQEVLAAWKKAAAPFAASFCMAGFRPGKAPLEVVEKRFFSPIAESATDALVERAVEHMLSEQGLTPVCALTYEGENARRGQPFSFKTEFCVLEDLSLPDLAGMTISIEEPCADAVQEQLFVRDILSREAIRENVTEGLPRDGDVVEIEVTGKMDGRTVPGMHTGSSRIRLMPVGPGEKVPDIDPVVRGLHVGETGTGTTPCPDNYPDPSMRGKSIELVVTLRSIERETLPSLTDETAQKLGFHDVEALRRSAHERALEMDRVHKMSLARQSLRDRLEHWQGFDAPQALVEQCRREIMHRSQRYLQRQFDSSDSLKETLAVMRAEAGKKAGEKARARALLLGWARKRGLEIPEREWQAVLAGRAARKNMDAAAYRRTLYRSGELFELRAAMLEERALSDLMQSAARS